MKKNSICLLPSASGIQFYLIACIIEWESKSATPPILIEFYPNGFMEGKMTSYKAMIYFLLKIISETVGLFIDFQSPLETWYINFRRWTFMTENNIKHRTLVKGKKKVKILITLGLCHFLWAASGSIPSSDGITAFALSLSHNDFI